MSLLVRLSSYWCAFQQYLFPTIEEDLGPLGERYQLFITVLEFVRVEQQLPCGRSLRGRPQQDRAALARAHHAAAVGRSCVARCDRDRGAREADSEAKASGRAETQARAPAQGRGTAQGAEPAAASVADDAAGDARRPAPRL